MAKRCKMSGCYEPVDPKARKQHCTAHMKAYNKKQQEYAARQRLLPECENYKFCQNKVPPGRERFCKGCQDVHDEAERIADEQASKWEQLEEIQDIEDVKDFLRKWMMDDD